jgi:hypothetical protein
MATAVVQSVSLDSSGGRSVARRSRAAEGAAAVAVAIFFLRVSWRAVYVHLACDFLSRWRMGYAVVGVS